MSDRVIRIVENLVAAAESPAVTLDYARRHLKSLGSSEDVLVQTWIQAATDLFQEETGRQLVTATWEAWLDAFPYAGRTPSRAQRIELPRPPLLTVDSVSYLDDKGDTQTFTDYVVVAPAGPYAKRGWVEPAPGFTWPIAADRSAAVQIRFTSGYGSDETTVPAIITGLLMMLVAQFDVYRSDVNEIRGVLLQLPWVQPALNNFKWTAFPTQLLHDTQWTSLTGVVR